jgi:hypothetical protein
MMNEMTPAECAEILENWPRNCNPLKKYISRMQAAAVMRKLAASELREDDAPTLDLVPVKCGECELHGHCTTEDVFKLARLSDDKQFCGAAKRKEQK